MQNNRTVIFTDLDGSLLNHGDYSFLEALPMLEKIKKEHIDLIFTTSKTKKECELLQEKMGIEAPFIVENGACIYYDDDSFELLGRPHKEIVSFIDKYKVRFGIRAFKDSSIEDIAHATGFSHQQAKLAKQRLFSEPFLIEDEKSIEVLKSIAKTEGFKILKGGRFYHCVGAGQDKGMAVRRALKCYEGYRSIALGDNFNDIAMLESVDIPILIPRFKGDYIPLDLPNLIKAPYKGSLGWNEALKQVL